MNWIRYLCVCLTWGLQVTARTAAVFVVPLSFIDRHTIVANARVWHVFHVTPEEEGRIFAEFPHLERAVGLGRRVGWIRLHSANGVLDDTSPVVEAFFVVVLHQVVEGHNFLDGVKAGIFAPFGWEFLRFGKD